jgi:oligopeptide/dipeptide ABC transporter ATP-binding protein
MADKLLDVRHLSVRFRTPEGLLTAVDDFSFDMAPGETLGLVGESGCGKSVLSMSMLGLLPAPPAEVRADGVFFEGLDLTKQNAEGLRRIRGRDISMIFQEPMTSLNPALTIGRQVAEPLMVHRGLSAGEAWAEGRRWLEHVKIPAAAERMRDYPHQLSGGMCQRVMIAMAMVCRPKLLIADEPTTALDVTIQAQILSLMVGLKEETGMAVLLITHDLGVVAQAADRVVVMYAGQVVETAATEDLFDHPFHPYTQGLLQSMPKLGRSHRRLREIPGTVPQLMGAALSCRFNDRCPHVFELCRQRNPDLIPVGSGQTARCWLKDYPERRRSHF